MTNNRWVRNSLIYLLIIIGVIVIFYTLLPSFGSSERLALTEVLTQARAGKIDPNMRARINQIQRPSTPGDYMQSVLGGGF